MGIIRAQGLTKAFGSVRALDAIDLDVAPGRIGLVGANGAGKSTLFRLLLGLIEPTSGSLEVLGHDTATQSLEIRARIGYMPEHDCLPLDLSAADAVAMLGEMAGLTTRIARRRASDVLDLVGLDEARFRPTGGYSTGMRQRTKLAQALVAGPDLVLLDEPTAGLDPSGRDAMLDLVRSLGDHGISFVMATHLLDDVARACDHVLVIDAGRLVSDDTVTALQQMAGKLVVDVGPDGHQLTEALARKGFQVSDLEDGTVEVLESHGVHEALRDQIAELGLPIYRLSDRRQSLDEVFTR